LNDYLAVNRGMTVERATFTIMIFGMGNFLGMLVGGYGGSYLYERDKRYPALLAGFMVIVGCVPFWILLNKIDFRTSICTTVPVSLLAGLCSGVTGPIIKATLQNVTLPQTRGQAFALFNTFDDFGRGLGPVFVAILISRLGGRTTAFNVGLVGWVACGLVNLCIFFTVERDENKTQEVFAQGLSIAAEDESVTAEEDLPLHACKGNSNAGYDISLGHVGDIPPVFVQPASRII
jgi:predicted MFS family arabinose efflux permease